MPVITPCLCLCTDFDVRLVRRLIHYSREQLT